MINYIKDEHLLINAWKKYVEQGVTIPESIPGVRPVIVESWRRSQNHGIHSDHIENTILPKKVFAEKLKNNEKLISISRPYLTNIYEMLKGTNSTLVLADKDGLVLEMFIDDTEITARAKETGLQPGCLRTEEIIGTSCIGTGLATKNPFQLYGHEHYLSAHHQYYAASAPIFSNSVMLALLCIVMPKEYATAQTLPMICVAADGIQNEYKLYKTNSELQIINARTETLLESIVHGVVVLDANKRVIKCNNNAKRMLNVSKHVIGKEIHEICSPENPIDLDAPFINCQDEEMEFIDHSSKRFTLSVSIFKNEGTHSEIFILLNYPNNVRSLVRKIAGLSAKFSFDSIIGNSPAIVSAKSLGSVVSKSDANVLITGESGTGKELFAQAIHNSSNRSDGPFVAINCASIPKSLIESELFGYAPGAFTGASKTGQPGKFELADGGTIFLDEIGDMPLDIQTSLLRVLQSHEVIQVGGKYPKPVDVRVIAATNVNLQKKIESHQFRDDLYYRLNVISLHLPSLKERKSDIPLLLEHFLKQHSNPDQDIPVLTQNASARFIDYDWPGNIRELENAVEHALILSKNGVIDVDSLPEPMQYRKRDIFANDAPSNSSVILQNTNRLSSLAVNTTKDRFISASRSDSEYVSSVQERETIIEILTSEHGDVTATALDLDMPKSTLYRKLTKYKINPRDYRIW